MKTNSPTRYASAILVALILVLLWFCTKTTYGDTTLYGTTTVTNPGTFTIQSGVTVSAPQLEPALGNPSTNGYVLSSTTAGVRSWIAPATGGGGGTPGGSDTYVQFNDAGVFGGDSTFFWQKANHRLWLPATSGGLGQGMFLGGYGQLQTYDSGTVSYLFFATNKYWTGSAWADVGYNRVGGMLQVENDQLVYYTMNTGTTSTEQWRANPNGIFDLRAAGMFGWGSTTPTSAVDTALARNSAGVVEINNGTAGQYRDLFLRNLTVSGTCTGCGGGGGGTVTSFSAGDLSPLFTTSETNPTTTPALSFTLSTAAANTVFGNATASTAAPTFSSSPRFTAIGNLTTNGFVTTSGGVGTLGVDATVYTPSTRLLTIAGLAANLSVDRTWTLDQILANNGATLGTGIIKRTAANTLAIATAGTDYLTGNQTITLTGDTTGSGTTAITTTTGKVNGVTYPASPGTNTVPVITTTNTVTYQAVPTLAGGLPTGGTANQVLSKVDATNYNTAWVSQPLFIVNGNSGTGQSVGTSDTYITNSTCTLPSGTLFAAGGQYKLRFVMSKTAAGVASWVLSIRLGAFGNTSDTVVATTTIGPQTAAVDALSCDLSVNIGSTGATANTISYMLYSHALAANTGYGGPAVTPVNFTQSATFNQTTAKSIGISFNGGAAHAGTVNIVQAQYTQ